MTVKSAIGGVFAAGLLAAANTHAADLFYSASGAGYHPWEEVSRWKIYNNGGFYNQLPTTNDNVWINASTLAAESGSALTVTNGVSAECYTFKTGYQNYSGTAWFQLDGGSLTCTTDFVTGWNYPGLATLEGGALYGGMGFYIGYTGTNATGTVTNNGATVDFDTFYLGYKNGTCGTLVQNGGSVYSAGAFLAGSESGSSGTLFLNGGSITGNSYAMVGRYGNGLAELNAGTFHCAGNLYIGDYSGSSGVLTNNGAQVSTDSEIRIGYSAGAFGRFVQNGGTLEAGAYLQVGQGGGNGEFEANAPFSAKVMLIGAGLAPTDPGTGTVTVTEGAVGSVDQYLRVNNGGLYMRGGTIHLNVSNGTATNLYVRTGEDRHGQIRGWGYIGYTNTATLLRMINNGRIIADGEGVERDLDLGTIIVVNNDIPNGATDTNGWCAVNKGRVIFPRSGYTVFTADVPKAVCLGDLYQKTEPEMVNSVGVTITYPSSYGKYDLNIRGGLCAAGRSDIPSGLPARLRPIGVWFVGSFDNDLVTPNPVSFTSAALTFRYDHTQVNATDSSLRLFHYDGSAWIQVGACLPGGDPLISTGEALAPVPSGDYNIGWFAVMAVERTGTMISVL